MGFHIELEAVIRGDLDPAADRPRTRPEYRAVQTHGGGPLPSWDANCIRKYPGEVAREIGGIQLEYVPDVHDVRCKFTKNKKVASRCGRRL